MISLGQLRNCDIVVVDLFRWDLKLFKQYFVLESDAYNFFCWCINEKWLNGAKPTSKSWDKANPLFIGAFSFFMQIVLSYCVYLHFKFGKKALVQNREAE